MNEKIVHNAVFSSENTLSNSAFSPHSAPARLTNARNLSVSTTCIVAELSNSSDSSNSSESIPPSKSANFYETTNSSEGDTSYSSSESVISYESANSSNLLTTVETRKFQAVPSKTSYQAMLSTFDGAELNTFTPNKAEVKAADINNTESNVADSNVTETIVSNMTNIQAAAPNLDESNEHGIEAFEALFGNDMSDVDIEYEALDELGQVQMSNCTEAADILESKVDPKLLKILLKDQTKAHLNPNADQKSNNIFWATSDYADFGEHYQYHDAIISQSITKAREKFIQPRVMKLKAMQNSRSRNMAEVFTPAWICNEQNNLVDERWFGRTGVFNVPFTKDGKHGWQTVTAPIEFPEGKSWQDYVIDIRLEVSCGEAPYLVSRYDVSSGELISLPERIGLLDRKLRVVSENTTKPKEWFNWAVKAFQSIYAYEWQGDSLLLAREALLLTFYEYFAAKFGKQPHFKWAQVIAEIISWNIWQMDGLKCVIPYSCQASMNVPEFLGLAGSTGLMFLDDLQNEHLSSEKIAGCAGCANNDILAHNGLYCLIKDWFTPVNEQSDVILNDGAGLQHDRTGLQQDNSAQSNGISLGGSIVRFVDVFAG